MHKLIKFTFAAGALAGLFGLAGNLWFGQLTQRDSSPRNPAGPYQVDGGAVWGGPTPQADGYVQGSKGTERYLPSMPPARAMDVHRADNVRANATLQSCFFPGPKIRPGFYSTDPDGYGIENQLPDNYNSFATAWFRLEPGAKIVIKGQYPHMRHWSFTTYGFDGVPRDNLDDSAIQPQPGSQNPFQPGVARDVSARDYRIEIVNGEPPTQRPDNTLYTLDQPGAEIGMHVRHYVPDHSSDYLGGVAVPQMEYQRANGEVLTGEAACAATAASLRGHQVPLAINPTVWLAMAQLPWNKAATTPALPFEHEPLEMFFNREYMVAKHFAPWLAFDRLAVQKGGFWSNRSTRYGYKYINQQFGKVYLLRGKMPSTPHTWEGNPAPLDQQTDMRYWSVCSVMAPPTGMTVDCLFDEQVAPTLDAKGYFSVLVSRAVDRPANARPECGVQWLEWGNGDGLVGGQPGFGAIINRHTLVNPQFQQSYFAVTGANQEQQAMGEYLPYMSNFHERQRFEALGCPIDTRQLDAQNSAH